MTSSCSPTNKNARLSIQTSRLILREARSTDLDDLHVIFSHDDAMKYCSTPPHTTISQSKKWLDGMIASPRNGLNGFVIELRTAPSTSASQESAPIPSYSHSPPSSTPTSSLTSTPIPTVSDSYPHLIPSLSSGTQSAPQTSGKPAVIGEIGCWSGSEIGFILSKTHWGNGYASESLGALLDHLFSQTSIGSNLGDCPGPNLTLRADVDPRNERCLRLLKKFGFSECGREEKTFETHLGWCDSVYLDLTRERWVVWKGMAGRHGS